MAIEGATDTSSLFENENEFLTTKQIAGALQKNIGTIQRWCREGRMPAAKIEGTFVVRKRDFDDWFNRKKIPSQQSVAV